MEEFEGYGVAPARDGIRARRAADAANGARYGWNCLGYGVAGGAANGARYECL